MKQEDSPNKTKPFEIPKRVVWEAWKQVAAKKGAAGVDGVTIDAYQHKLGRNLYRLWNRMSSGSYQPAAVRQVLIPKGDGNMRPLGIPTIDDRIAQMVVKRWIEPRLEEIFHPWSFGYRPGRAALDAVWLARRNCWESNWVIDLDIKGFFDTIDHDLLMRAVELHVKEPWIRLYVRRWLTCPVQVQDGTLEQRDRGTPQGGVISPLLANLFLHYVFDVWMRKHHRGVPFERYADDIVCHCNSKTQADTLLQLLQERFRACGLTLHPQKTRVVYCRDSRRRSQHSETSFDFLGFSFHARTAQDRKGNLFAGFQPAVSPKALKHINRELRLLRVHRRTEVSLQDLAALVNAKLRGWIAYFGGLYPEPLKRCLVRLDLRLASWGRRKYKPLRGHRRRSWAWLKQCRLRNPQLFAHWGFVYGSVRGSGA